jgi:hypothetical protein
VITAAGARSGEVISWPPGDAEDCADRAHGVYRVTARTLCATTAFFYDLLGHAQDLDFHGLPAQRPLEFPDLGVGLAQVASGDHVLTSLDRHRGPGLREPLPVAKHTRRDVQFAAELGERLLAGQDPLNRRSLELRAGDPPAVCLPPVLAHGPPRRILRPQGEQSKWGAHQPRVRCRSCSRSISSDMDRGRAMRSFDGKAAVPRDRISSDALTQPRSSNPITWNLVAGPLSEWCILSCATP